MYFLCHGVLLPYLAAFLSSVTQTHDHKTSATFQNLSKSLLCIFFGKSVFPFSHVKGMEECCRFSLLYVMQCAFAKSDD